MGKAKKNKYSNKVVEYDGIEFDSKLERDFYQLLQQDGSVTQFQLQPEYTLLDSYDVPCWKCRGQGQMPSPRTGNPVKCTSCKGSAVNKRRATVYVADFWIRYTDGYEEVVDVKGFVTEAFGVKKKLFEWRTGQRLVVVTRKNGAWVKK